MTGRIESNKILEDTEDSGEIHLLINLNCTVIVADHGYPLRNTPHSTSRAFCETKVNNSQHNTEAITYHYSQVDDKASVIKKYLIE